MMAVLDAELAKEVTIDEREKATVPPLVPANWTFTHVPGARSFTLQRQVHVHELAPVCTSHDILAAPDTALRWGGLTRERAKSSALYRTVTVRAAMAVQDPSFWDATYDVCELVPFDVVVSAPTSATSRCMAVAMESANSRLRIRSLSFVDYATLALAADPEHLQQHRVYRGPVMRDLSTELHTGIMDYLNALGVDARLAEFVCQMLSYTEHQEYLAWLRRVGVAACAMTPSG